MTTLCNGAGTIRAKSDIGEIGLFPCKTCNDYHPKYAPGTAAPIVTQQRTKAPAPAAPPKAPERQFAEPVLFTAGNDKVTVAPQPASVAPAGPLGRAPVEYDEASGILKTGGALYLPSKPLGAVPAERLARTGSK